METINVPKLKDLFNYEYKGGGYFRLKGVPKNKPAPILHGEESINFIYNELIKCITHDIEKNI
jgi:hypothetical protein